MIAAGDSYNDTTMLGEADHGFLFDAPANVIAEFPQFPAINGYDALKEAIRSVSQRNIPAYIYSAFLFRLVLKLRIYNQVLNRKR